MKENKNRFKHSKSLGQNFLHDQNILRKICDLSDINQEETVVEIGPGQGALTSHLIEKAKSVIAIEKDKRLIEFLTDKFKNNDNFEIINEDVLKVDLTSFNDLKNLKLVSNLPYNITGPILIRLFKNKTLFSKIVLTIQKEVGDKICSKKDTKSYGSLSIIIQNYFEVKSNFKIPPTAFYPQPKVDSVVVSLKPLEKPRHFIKDEKIFETVTRQAFSTRRKTIKNSLENYFDKTLVFNALENSSIDQKRRAESLSIKEFANLANSFYELVPPTSSISSLF